MITFGLKHSSTHPFARDFRGQSSSDDPLERYRALLSAEDFDRLRATIQRPLPPALRVNTLKIDLETARRTWPMEYGWRVQDVPFCPSGWQISGAAENLSRTVEHRTGFYYLQDAASMPPQMFDYDADFPLILDGFARRGRQRIWRAR
jgi:16S rRNA (cytosine1407-C5)-methyltransferase